jgi:hypothetical protein
MVSGNLFCLRIQNIYNNCHALIIYLFHSCFPTSEITPDYVDMAYEIEGDTVSNSNSNSVSDPIRQEVAAQAAKRRHTLVHGSNTNSNGNAANENTQQGRMVLETELACSSCGASMHWSSAKFCWSCGEQMV